MKTIKTNRLKWKVVNTGQNDIVSTWETGILVDKAGNNLILCEILLAEDGTEVEVPVGFNL